MSQRRIVVAVCPGVSVQAGQGPGDALSAVSADSPVLLHGRSLAALTAHCKAGPRNLTGRTISACAGLHRKLVTAGRRSFTRLKHTRGSPKHAPGSQLTPFISFGTQEPRYVVAEQVGRVSSTRRIRRTV